MTGHPAVTVPAGLSAGLPVGVMLIGRHWEDSMVLRAADAFQKLGCRVAERRGSGPSRSGSDHVIFWAALRTS